ncbi:MAG: hypothetical protein ACYSTF_07605 [Planctomycetota bacterium]
MLSTLTCVCDVIPTDVEGAGCECGKQSAENSKEIVIAKEQAMVADRKLRQVADKLRKRIMNI